MITGAHLWSFSDAARLGAGFAERIMLMNTNMCCEAIIKLFEMLKSTYSGWLLFVCIAFRYIYLLCFHRQIRDSRGHRSLLPPAT
jgi:hypothetical protein